jgi:Mn2+/Fe2+ NRAMP family transporter
MTVESGKHNFLKMVGPGLLVAATGVGAGDLATATFTGSQLGVTVLWAVLVGAGLKYVLTEGLARWQLATGDTLLEGCMSHLGTPFRLCFLLYLLPWTFFVGSALMGACGVTFHAMVPIFDDASRGKLVFGILHSVVGVVLVRLGGYRLFERVMKVCIAVMFVTVLITAIAIKPDWSAVVAGLFIPRIPDLHGQGMSWTIALMGGVGGTLTILNYGYWIREEDREGTDRLNVCRIDLATGYIMTALFGISMVIIGSQITIEGQGAGLIVAIADRLQEPVGPVGRWAFLLGAWGAVFSSLLGVWQCVPLIFTDFWSLRRGTPSAAQRETVSDKSPVYRIFLYALATIPIFALQYGFRDIQRLYAVIGALFMPFMACVLLYLNGSKKWVDEKYRNGIPTTILLVATMLFFIIAGWIKLTGK